MPGQHVIGLFADFRREGKVFTYSSFKVPIDYLLFLDEGEYICPRCTIFGLEKDEVQTLVGLGFKMTDHNKEDEGYEVQSSVFKVRIALETCTMFYNLRVNSK